MQLYAHKSIIFGLNYAIAIIHPSGVAIGGSELFPLFWTTLNLFNY